MSFLRLLVRETLFFFSHITENYLLQWKVCFVSVSRCFCLFHFAAVILLMVRLRVFVAWIGYVEGINLNRKRFT